jgi:hypothetical protein
MSWRVDLRYPFLSPAPVSQAFGVNPTAYAAYGLPYHNGVDFAVITGTPVVAAAPGTVAKVQHDVGGYGLHVVLDCEKQGEKFRVIYAHLSENAVHVSEQVTEGQIIGKSGNTGNSTGPHLHFEVRPEDARKPGSYVPGAQAVDPQAMFLPLEPVKDVLYQARVLSAEGLNVRSGMGTGYPIVAAMAQHAVFDVLEEGYDARGNKWVRQRVGWSCWGMDGKVWLERVSGSTSAPSTPYPSTSSVTGTIETRLAALEAEARSRGWQV